jgi:hypothetical protein
MSFSKNGTQINTDEHRIKKDGGLLLFMAVCPAQGEVLFTCPISQLK